MSLMNDGVKRIAFGYTRVSTEEQTGIQDKIFGTQVLSPLFSVIDNKKEPYLDSGSGMVNQAESQWNDLISDIYRIKGIVSVLYPTTTIP